MKNKWFRTIKRKGNKYQLKVCNKYLEYELLIPKSKFSKMQVMFEAWHNHVMDMQNTMNKLLEDALNEEW